ncbi:hypothetical protein DID74_01490 [Candidatus Marinamargulisbacteria bacterium SCGC AG-333-B06]|nr:hypothetical protein DID74_01490 [Candidatus Marinamargulisbacteria bacterium SCGC AG-333-B06]
MINLLSQTFFMGIVIGLIIFLWACLKKTLKTYNILLLSIMGWLCLTGVLSINGFFNNFNTIPPRIVVVILPMILLLIYVAISSKILTITRCIPQTWLINIQAFRIGIELLFVVLAGQHMIPEIMTWDGRNFDVLVGISAPFIAYFCFIKRIWNRNIALVWNIISMLLLLNVFTHGLLSAPTPFQLFFTDPPNTFVAEFPYIWLPSFIVPFAFCCHIISIRKYLQDSKNQ